ncbi:MAG: PAS domain S-box protein [Verrucomicrobia bacterium]|nr:PAS domain S-box protein [Verrucomicrobiota bacterium]
MMSASLLMPVGALLPQALNPWWPAVIVAVLLTTLCGWLRARRQAETAKAVDLYRFLFENALEGIYENPVGGGFRTVNPAMVRILGYANAETLLKITPEEVEKIYVVPGRRAEFLGMVARNEVVSGFESEIRRPDGSTRWISENVRVVRDGAGRVVSIQGFVTDITDRRLAEAALRESEERYRGLYLANPYPMWIYDRETLRILSVNDAAVALYGYTRAEFEQMTLTDLRPEREWEHVRSAVRSMQTGPNQMGVFTHRCKNGRELQVEVTTLVFTFHGREQVLSIGNDLTEREQARLALHDSEFRYRLLFENSPLALVEFDYRPVVEWMDGLRASGVADLATWADDHGAEFAAAMRRVPLIGINRAALRLLKSASMDETTANQERIMTDSAWTLRRQSMLAVWSGRNESEGEMKVRAIDGTECHVHCHWWVPTLNDRSHFERTPAVIVDLTATKAAERALAEERERLAVTLRAMAEGVITTNRDGSVLFINQAAIKLTGWTASAAAGRPITEVCVLRHARTGAPVATPVAAAIASGGVIDLPPQTQVLRRIGGRGLVEGCCAPMLDATGRGIGAVLVLRDVTERSRMESELERASKLESVGILAGGIAHDFNNILAVVMGNLTLAQLDPSTENAPLAKWLQEAERATLRARDLTQQLLTFAKGGDPVRTAVRLPEVVREATEFSLHGSTVRGEFNTEADLWAAEVDRSQIGQVVQNLVINAMQAMKNGGIIRVSLRNVELAPGGPVPLPAGRYLELSIADTGAGISPEHLARIFEPYFTTKEQGSGLGLATVYSIIRKHQGHVAVESEMGKGTTFRIWLPAAKEAPPAPPVGKSAMEPMTGRVLFMDDEDPIRTMVEVLLTRLGLQVMTVPDGTDLIREFQAARTAGKAFDVVIMDLTVPGGMGGKEAMQELQKIDPDVRAIVSSGYSGDPVLANFRAHGFCGIVPKPYRLSDLANAVRTALKK